MIALLTLAAVVVVAELILHRRDRAAHPRPAPAVPTPAPDSRKAR